MRSVTANRVREDGEADADAEPLDRLEADDLRLGEEETPLNEKFGDHLDGQPDADEEEADDRSEECPSLLPSVGGETGRPAKETAMSTSSTWTEMSVHCSAGAADCSNVTSRTPSPTALDRAEEAELLDEVPLDLDVRLELAVVEFETDSFEHRLELLLAVSRAHDSELFRNP